MSSGPPGARCTMANRMTEMPIRSGIAPRTRRTMKPTLMPRNPERWMSPAHYAGDEIENSSEAGFEIPGARVDEVGHVRRVRHKDLERLDLGDQRLVGCVAFCFVV